jgi:hypothetical protein
MERNRGRRSVWGVRSLGQIVVLCVDGDRGVREEDMEGGEAKRGAGTVKLWWFCSESFNFSVTVA